MDLRSFSDRFAIAVSGLCVIHCLAFPVLLVLLPSLSSLGLGEEHFHQWLLYAIIPSSIIALGLGCKKHKRYNILATGLLGLAIICFAGFFGHDLVGETGEKALTVLGSVIIIWGHVQNHRACKHNQHVCADGC